MANTSVTDAELSVLKLLWEDENMTVRQLTDKLYPSGTNSDIATVQKLIQRLEKKKLVKRDRSQHAHSFSALISQQEFAGEQLAEMADKLSDGSMTPLLIHLFENKKLSKKEQDEILQILKKHK